MNGFDLLLVVLAVVAAIGGWRIGFVRRFSAWLGAALGVGLGILLLPLVIDWINVGSDQAILLTTTALLVLLASVGQAVGAVLGARLHHGVVDRPSTRSIDACGGSVLGVVGVVALIWLVLPVMGGTSGWASSAARRSSIAHAIDALLPDPPRQITDLERHLAGGQFPELFSGLRAAPDIPAPPTGSPVSPEIFDRAAPSAVRLSSRTCGRVQSGSGFVIADDVVVTNAHVVAAATDVRVETADGAAATGRVIAFDPATDLALVAAPLDRPPLEIAEPEEGDRGLVLGFPRGGPFDPSPFEVGERLGATGYDIYDSAMVDRDLLALAAALEQGDSGSAVLRADGLVIGVAVAIAPDRPDVAYALDISELTELLDALAGRTLGEPVDTGPCIG